MNKKYRFVRFLLLSVMLSITGKLHAEGKVVDSSGSTSLKTAGAVLIGVSGLLLNAEWASRNPEGYGAVTILLSPLYTAAGSKANTSDAAITTSIGNFVALGIYNISELSKDKYDKKERRRQNLVAFPLIIGLNMAAQAIFPKESIARKITLQPSHDRMQLSFNQKF